MSGSSPLPASIIFLKGGYLTTEANLSSILSDIGSFVTAGVGWMGTVADYVMGEPFVLLMAVIIPLSGWAIGGLKRLTRL